MTCDLHVCSRGGPSCRALTAGPLSKRPLLGGSDKSLLYCALRQRGRGTNTGFWSGNSIDKTIYTDHANINHSPNANLCMGSLSLTFHRRGRVPCHLSLSRLTSLVHTESLNVSDRGMRHRLEGTVDVKKTQTWFRG